MSSARASLARPGQGSTTAVMSASYQSLKLNHSPYLWTGALASTVEHKTQTEILVSDEQIIFGGQPHNTFQIFDTGSREVSIINIEN